MTLNSWICYLKDMQILFLLFDNLIATGRFLEFILEFIDIRNEEKIYDYWLHKVFDKGFEEFKKQVMGDNEIADVDNQKCRNDNKRIYEYFK